jgi:hypothetical protein
MPIELVRGVFSTMPKLQPRVARLVGVVPPTLALRAGARVSAALARLARDGGRAPP